MSWTKALIGQAAGIGLYFLIRFYFDVPFEAMLAGVLAGVFILAIGFPIGMLAGHFLSHGSDVDAKAFRFVGWVNLVAWLIPVLGLTLSYVTYQFSKRSDDHRFTYRLLANAGGMLALINAAYGGASTQMDEASRQAFAAQVNGGAPTIHSRQRCPYAAIEAWPREDIETYCR